jgi:hypothetical protein
VSPDSNTDGEDPTSDSATLEAGAGAAGVDVADTGTTPRDGRGAQPADATTGTNDTTPSDGARIEASSANGTTPAQTPDEDATADDRLADRPTADEGHSDDESAVSAESEARRLPRVRNRRCPKASPANRKRVWFGCRRCSRYSATNAAVT